MGHGDRTPRPGLRDDRTQVDDPARDTLLDSVTDANKRVRDAQKALDDSVKIKYSQLSEDEVKTLVIEDKWLATLEADVQSELNRISQSLAGRIQQLAARYATPLSTLTNEVETLNRRVEQHLKEMGFVWS